MIVWHETVLDIHAHLQAEGARLKCSQRMDWPWAQVDLPCQNPEKCSLALTGKNILGLNPALNSKLATPSHDAR